MDDYWYVYVFTVKVSTSITIDAHITHGNVMFILNNIQVIRPTIKWTINGISSTDCFEGANTCESI